MYIRELVSLQQAEELLFVRGIDICPETVRHWWNRCGPKSTVEVIKWGLPHGHARADVGTWTGTTSANLAADLGKHIGLEETLDHQHEAD